MNPLDPFRFDFNSFLNGLLGSKTFEGKTDLLKHDVTYEIPESLDNLVLPCFCPMGKSRSICRYRIVAASQRQRRRSVGERRSVAASEASQRQREPGASQRRSVAAPEASQRRGEPGASQRRSVGGVAASGVRRERRSVAVPEASQRRREPGASQRRSVGGVAASGVRRERRSVAASEAPGPPRASQRRSAPRWPAPFPPALLNAGVNGARPTGRSHEAAKPRDPGEAGEAAAPRRSREAAEAAEAAKPQRPGEAAKPRKPRSRSAPEKPRSRGSREAAKPQRPEPPEPWERPPFKTSSNSRRRTSSFYHTARACDSPQQGDPRNENARFEAIGEKYSLVQSRRYPRIKNYIGGTYIAGHLAANIREWET